MNELYRMTQNPDGTYCFSPVIEKDQWAFPVGDQEYPPEDWYAATVHDLTGAKNNGYKHSGYDLNLDLFEHGDVERRLGLGIYSITYGIVYYVTDSWSDVPMMVLKYWHNNQWLFVRYAHIVTDLVKGDLVKRGQLLGTFADWRRLGGGDHLHLDMATSPFTREWLNKSVSWVDPAPILKAHLDPVTVDEMLKKG